VTKSSRVLPPGSDAAGLNLALGRRLQLARLSAALSEDQFAKAMGLRVGTVRQYEAGERRFVARRLVQAARILERPLSFFFTDEAWLATQLGLEMLLQPEFAPLRRLLALWRRHHGRMPGELFGSIEELGLTPRTILLRWHRSTDLVHEHVPTGVPLMKPCQWLHLIGRDVEELPDPGYGAWAKRVYLDVLASGRPRLDAVRVTMPGSSGATVHSSYDRLALPWIRTDRDLFVSAVSIQREFSVTH
jgi:transcriptional regulator with XRE-family HTH domain